MESATSANTERAMRFVEIITVVFYFYNIMSYVTLLVGFEVTKCRNR